MAANIPFSARISPDDIKYLESIRIEGVESPSDRLRYIIADHRKLAGSGLSGSKIKSLLERQLNPIDDEISRVEHETHCRSDLIHLVRNEGLKLIQELFDIKSEQLNLDELSEFEANLADRLVILIESFLSLGVTHKAPCLDPDIIRTRIDRSAELIEVISNH